MTMADTIAVMNAGRIEQMGAPMDLYENPVTTFVANFLGQSNLIRGTITGTSGGDSLLDVQGVRMAMPTSRVHSAEPDVWVGVRPEKMHVERAGSPTAEGHNLVSAAISDVSYIGVSTQYLARLPWGQEVGIFAQNMTTQGPLRVGDEVSLSWDPANTFALDAQQDADAGAEKIEGDA